MRRIRPRRLRPGFASGARARIDAGALAARLTAVGLRRPVLVAAVAVLLAIGSLLLALRLDPTARTDTIVDPDSQAARATERFHRQFGDEPITVLVRGQAGTSLCEPVCRLTDLLLTQDLARMAALEGCLSGNIPRGAEPLAPVCAEFARRKPIRVVFGPGTFINESARQVASRFEAQRRQKSGEAAAAARAAREVAKARGLGEAEQERLARRARQLVYAQFARDALGLALRYGLRSIPSLNNPEFVLRLVFEPSLGAGVPKARFAYLFPSEHSALIQARLRPGLSDGEKERTIEMVREAVSSRGFRLERGEYVVSGLPVVAQGLASTISDQLVVLIVAALLLAGLMLLLFFGSSLRLLPLALALVVVALTFGVAALVGAPLTIATIAVAPVLIGLAVGYAVQLQARFDQERRGEPPSAMAGQPSAATPREADEAALRTAAAGSPAIAAGVAAASAGFLTMLLSPAPMVRWFGALLAVGVLFALALALIAGLGVLGRAARFGAPGLLARLAAISRSAARAGKAALRPVRGALARVRLIAAARGPLRRTAGRLRSWVTGVGRRPVAAAARHPGRVLATGLAIALVGVVLDGRNDVKSDIELIAPADLREIEDARALRSETGAAGEVNVVVRSQKLTSPGVIAWMVDYQKRVLSRQGYREERPCREANLCPSLSLTNLFGSGAAERPRQIRALVEGLPTYFSQSVISPDRQTAIMAFGIRLMPLDEQKDLVDNMRAQLDPPAGVRAELAGAPVLAADGNAELESSRPLLTLAALAAALLVLLAIYGRLERVVPTLIPVALAAGWSGLVLFALSIPLNPMSAALGVLVVAVTAQFSVILATRFREERAAGLSAAVALERTYRRNGAAVLIAGAAAIAGFGALIFSDARMLRDLGIVMVVDLTLVLIGVMIVLPAALVWAERRRPLRVPRSREEVRAVARGAQTGARSAGRALVRGAARGGRAMLATGRRLRKAAAGKRPRTLRRQ